MGKKTKIDYETVEKEIEYTECDVPSCFNTDEESELIELAVNPKYDKERRRDRWRIEKVFENKKDARDFMNRREREEIKHHHKIKHAVKRERRVHTKDARCDANFFVCHQCLQNQLGVDIDELDKVSDIEASGGKVLIKQEYEPLFSIGTWVSIAIIALLLLIITFMAFDWIAMSWAFGL